MAPKPKPVSVVKPTELVSAVKPTESIVKLTTPVVDKNAITTEEEIVLGVTLAIIAAVIIIYKR